ncbi:exodeoxyribonuclease III [Corynebacterium sp. 320]|uniref:exodeoxyribonuclease III n=1 Tax=Corynebacterium TaxID=1716 RepID=UPI00125CB876|nr:MULTISPECIES: exodeoxyribonuclease III [Corynebacterium]KAB1503080.1 exodeoxyribonuclease III [Corynebacterium sp. 320]KAB1550709.1 exodeoxyribonuclease III [Corynebacterium sp. 321]KAB1551068.1 exodeoxyribonuclease III [Corynebacterium sp. 319]KAB3526877.1 exodeoxyribonuclease III [Corynebacterium sp. 250]KAB3538370.1 exodeoxyribonuclease III [Corynebacterium sp. 366]
MRIATWNINSVRTREERVRAFLQRADVDVLCLQETKRTDAQFPDFTDTGYEQAHFGLHSFNGVAILSRIGLKNVKTEFGQPGFNKDLTAEQALEARAIGATVGGGAGDGDGVEVWSLYVPNGRAISDPHYSYKLRWLKALAGYAGKDAADGGADRLILVGDYNIAPRDKDVWDRSFFDGKTHVTPRERTALDELERAGMTQATELIQDQYTYWDYQALRFQKNEGMRIDLHYARGVTATDARVDRDERTGKGASDHAPVIVDYTLP